MIKDEISKEILARMNPGKTGVISICGAADLGKSFLSKDILESLRKHNLRIVHFTLDSYLIEREVRKRKGLSGYQIESYHVSNVLKDLRALKAGKTIELYPYDHTLGKARPKSKKVKASDIVIFDGLHTMHPSFMPYIDMTVFLYTSDKNLKVIRSQADLIKRKYTKAQSINISESEFNAYKTNVEPYKEVAQYLLFLESKWRFRLIRKGNKNE